MLEIKIEKLLRCTWDVNQAHIACFDCPVHKNDKNVNVDDADDDDNEDDDYDDDDDDDDDDDNDDDENKWENPGQREVFWCLLASK